MIRGPPAEPNLPGAVMFDRIFGLEARELERAIEAPCWSPRTRVALRARHARLLEAHAHWPDLLPRRLEEVFTAYTGLSFAAAKEAVLQRVAEAVQDTTAFGVGLGNTLGRQLLTAYAAPQYDEESLVRRQIVTTFRAPRVVAVSRVADLPAVAENASYPETSALSTVLATASPTKHGVIETILLEAVRNDDIMAISRRVQDLGEAARRTLAKAIWQHWIGNSVYGGDTLPWFHATHGNTGTAALSQASLKTALTQWAAQTGLGSSEKLGIPLRENVWLVVPPELIDVAFGLNQSTANVDGWAHHLFGATNERVIVNSFATDSTDWGLHYDSRLVESIRVVHVDREEPTIVLADEARLGSLFTHDRIQYRVHRHWTTLVADYRGAQKFIAAG
jgi:hypothetical protein